MINISCSLSHNYHAFYKTKSLLSDDDDEEEDDEKLLLAADAPPTPKPLALESELDDKTRSSAPKHTHVDACTILRIESLHSKDTLLNSFPNCWHPAAHMPLFSTHQALSGSGPGACSAEGAPWQHVTTNSNATILVYTL